MGFVEREDMVIEIEVAWNDDYYVRGVPSVSYALCLHWLPFLGYDQD